MFGASAPRLERALPEQVIFFPIDSILCSESIGPSGVASSWALFMPRTGAGKSTGSVECRNARRFYGRYGMKRNPYHTDSGQSVIFFEPHQKFNSFLEPVFPSFSRLTGWIRTSLFIRNLYQASPRCFASFPNNPCPAARAAGFFLARVKVDQALAHTF